MTRKLLSIIISVLIILSVLPVVVFAGTADTEQKLYEKKYVYDENNVMNSYYVDSNGRRVELDDEMLLCMSATDSSIPSKYDSREFGRVTSVKNQNPLGDCWAFAFCAAAESSLISQGYTNEDIDLSEAHLIWFRTANYIEGSDIPVQQDNLISITDTFDDGGTDFDAVATVARWSGFTAESDFPYVGSKDTTAMHFDSKDMFENDYNLVSARVLNINNIDEVKTSIMNYGAVSTTMYYTNEAVNYSENGCNHYYSREVGSNHAVTIVGWDDNYSASNFKTTPPSDGAWLVKNSWGPNANTDGYFWLSYCDENCWEFMEVVAKPAGEYDNNYQYDGITTTSAFSYRYMCYAANVFTAEGFEIVKGCGFYTANNANYTCTASIYTGLENAENPTSGRLAASKTISCLKKGYYTVDFDENVYVKPNESFAVVIKYSNLAGSAIVPYESLTNLEFSYTVEPGQSFYKTETGSWTDLTTENKGNLPIKAFTVDEAVTLESFEITEMPKTEYFEYDMLDLTGLEVALKYSNGVTIAVPVNELDVSPVDFCVPGTKTVTLTYKDYTVSYEITVLPIEITGIEFSSYPFMTECIVGDEFTTEGIELAVSINNGEVDYLTDGFEVTQPDLSTAGTKEVTVTFEGFTLTYEIVVYDNFPIELEIATLPDKLDYTNEDVQLDTAGLTLNVMLLDGTVETVTEGFTCTGFDTAESGTKTITVSYADLVAEFEINVSVITAESIEIATLPQTDYFIGDSFTADGLMLNVRYSDGTVKTVSDGYTVGDVDMSVAGEQTVKVNYGELETSFTVNISEPTVTPHTPHTPQPVYISPITILIIGFITVCSILWR